MQMSNIPFEIVDWANVERTEHHGETGVAYWQTCNFGNIRVRMVEYSPGYLADHWCTKGHILLCIARTPQSARNSLLWTECASEKYT